MVGGASGSGRSSTLACLPTTRGTAAPTEGHSTGPFKFIPQNPETQTLAGLFFVRVGFGGVWTRVLHERKSRPGGLSPEAVCNGSDFLATPKKKQDHQKGIVLLDGQRVAVGAVRCISPVFRFISEPDGQVSNCSSQTPDFRVGDLLHVHSWQYHSSFMMNNSKAVEFMVQLPRFGAFQGAFSAALRAQPHPALSQSRNPAFEFLRRHDYVAENGNDQNGPSRV